MATPILLPRQGQSVESCIITEFYVSVGDKVEAGTPLFAYETDKASFEEEATEEGTVLALFFEAGDEVPVLTNVGVIGKEGESIEEFRPGGASTEKVSETPAKVVEKTVAEDKPVSTSNISEGKSRIFATPRAKKLAKEKQISLDLLQGSGPNGRIIFRDVEAFADSSASKPQAQTIIERPVAEQRPVQSYSKPSNVVYGEDSETVPLTNMRKLIASAMHRSLQNSAQLTHHLGADARKIMECRQQVKAAQKEGYEHNITLNDMICMSVIRTLKKFPSANSHFLGESMRIFKKVHLGLAVDTDRGLMVPAVKNADDLSLQGLSSQMKGLAEQCRKGSIDPDLLAPEAASFTVSNLGNYGVEMFTPVINLPQAAILGVNTILPRPKDLGNGTYAFVPTLGLSLTYDHQALDGGEATRFLKAIAVEIENFEIDL